MAFSQSLPWSEPLDLAAAIDEPYWALLYSGVQAGYSGRYSLLAHGLLEKIESEDFCALEARLTSDRPAFDNAWFGYLSYGLKHSLEQLPPDRSNWLALPDLCMMRFLQVYHFDHKKRAVTLWSTTPPPAGGRPGGGHDSPNIISPHPNTPPAGEGIISSLRSNMTRQEYLDKAAHVIERIHAGDLYQANLTRKFMGEFAEAPKPFDLFRKLCAVSPAPYSAFLRLGDTHVLSSSPELFLRIDAEGRICTRPIKGTAPRFSDAGKDAASRDALQASAKDKAENLMIADLMRNDLSRACIPGSVATERLFEVTSHATIHHMSSTITGRKRPDCSTLEAVQCCFPPGSMTGAPKLAAIRLCTEMEALERGIYSGAIGWFGGDGSAELSVVIRTLLLQGNRFEFQVGGGIVADSTPEQELQELIDKAGGICRCLGIGVDELQ
ncbi:MAG: anthranilate synthase component I family protein [Pseudomonadota bacterium]|nr:anthranilate synthase component I family protein [Pseudomonadota bacterium]